MQIILRSVNQRFQICNHELVLVFFAKSEYFFISKKIISNMKKINEETFCITQEQYNFACSRVEALMREVHGDTPKDDPKCIELSLMAELQAKYEEVHFKIEKPTIAEIIADALDDMGLSQKKLAEIIGISPSRISEYISGKAEPTLKIAGKLCKVLNIPPAEMLMY